MKAGVGAASAGKGSGVRLLGSVRLPSCHYSFYPFYPFGCEEVLPQMNADEHRYRFRRSRRGSFGAFYAFYSELGFGFVESVYREAMRIVPKEAGMPVLAETSLKATFRGRVVGDFRADLLVSGLVAVELKAVRSLDPIHTAQLLNYLRCSSLEVGLLLNFGPKPQVRRLAFENSRKRVTSTHRAE